MPVSRSARSRIGLAVVLIGFVMPLALQLHEPELSSDEAIYSYAVDRMLDTGEWLTPRSIPTDEPFLEKPPLKFWLVAGAMQSGLLPRTDAGMRGLDAVFGGVAMLYIFLLGQRLSGTVGGLVAVLVVFSFEPLLFDHGLRSNNMESPLFLAYCGGMYHFTRWLDGHRPRLHAVVVGLWFTLGFLTKFVAALFLPIVLLLAVLITARGREHTSARSTDWLLPSFVVAVLAAPWFIYESMMFGSRFWDVILGVHVYQRFAGTLDPGHIHAWYFYPQTIAHELARAGSALLVLAGIIRLGYLSHRGEHLPRVILMWLVIPLMLMSFGTSKLVHYAYPFLPPFGLAAGAVFSWALDSLISPEGVIRRRLTGGLSRLFPKHEQLWPRASAGVRSLLIGGSIVFGAIAVWTFFAGPLNIEADGVTLLRNNSPIRPALFAVAFLVLARASSRSLTMLAGAAALIAVLPIAGYAERLHQIGRVDHPLRAVRDCAGAVTASGAAVGAGVLKGSAAPLHHSYYYYLAPLGPWVMAPEFNADLVRERLTAAGQQTPVVLTPHDADALRAITPPIGSVLTTGAVHDRDGNILLLPGPFEGCTQAVVDAGGWR